VRPAGIGGHPEDVLGFVFVRVFGIGPGVVALTGEELGAVFLESVGDVFEEDEAELALATRGMGLRCENATGPRGGVPRGLVEGGQARLRAREPMTTPQPRHDSAKTPAGAGV
jgi:hypothetical protein